MGEENKAGVLDVLVTSTINSFCTQRRFPTDITIGELKQKLELISGGCASTMELQLLDDKNEVIAKLNDNSTTLSSYSLHNAKILHVIDSSLPAGEFEDFSKVKKFELSEEEYAKRGDTLRAFKEQMKLQKDGELKNVAEKKLKEEEELAKNINVGSRCEVRIAGKPSRLGTVMYVGKTEFKPGSWVGVKYDEPVGKNDGSVNGKKYFECFPKYGGFVKPHDVIVGDFPEETFDDLDEL